MTPNSAESQLPEGYEITQQDTGIRSGFSLVEHRPTGKLYLVTAVAEEDNIIKDDEVGVIKVQNETSLKSAERGFAQEIFELDEINYVGNLSQSGFKDRPHKPS